MLWMMKKKPTKNYYYLTFIHKLGYKNIIIKIDRLGKMIEDWRNGSITWEKIIKEKRSNKYRYCSIDAFQKIKSINEVLSLVEG